MQGDGIGQQAPQDTTHQGLGYFLTIRGDRIEAAPSDFFARLGYAESPGLPPEQLLHPDDWRGLQSDLAQVGERGMGRIVRFRQHDGRYLLQRVMAWIDPEQPQPTYYLIGNQGGTQASLANGSPTPTGAGVAEREEFLTLMSHEIRTPLSALTGILQLLGHTEPTGEQQRLIDAANQLSEHLIRLLNDVLDASRVRAGKMVLHLTEFDLYALLTKLLTSYRPLYPHLALTLEYAADMPHTVRGDTNRMAQIVTNLLGNALKFTEQGGVTIAVSLDSARKSYRLTVRDTGVGLSRERIASLFQPYVEGSTQTNRLGTGLGLYISKQLVELHGGEIQVDSQEGKGTGITCQFPLAPSLEEEGESQPKQTDNPPDPPMDTGGVGLLNTGRKGHGKNVMVVDDNPINSLIVNKFLARWGYEPASASSGPEALEKLDNGGYGLILMDLRMPGMSGIETAQAIRNRADERANTPIVALTASTEPGVKEAVAACGMDGYIFKPFDAERLREVVKRFLEE